MAVTTRREAERVGSSGRVPDLSITPPSRGCHTQRQKRVRIGGAESNYTPHHMSTNTNRYKHIPSTQAALKLGIRPHTLACWRMKGCGPSYVRLGGPHGRVVYAEEEVAAYLASRTSRAQRKSWSVLWTLVWQRPLRGVCNVRPGLSQPHKASPRQTSNSRPGDTREMLRVPLRLRGRAIRLRDPNLPPSVPSWLIAAGSPMPRPTTIASETPPLPPPALSKIGVPTGPGAADE